MTQQEGERIAEIINFFCISKAEFARQVKESPQTVSNWIKRGFGKNVMDKIVTAFPQVNANWLLTGDGEMIQHRPPQGYGARGNVPEQGNVTEHGSLSGQGNLFGHGNASGHGNVSGYGNMPEQENVPAREDFPAYGNPSARENAVLLHDDGDSPKRNKYLETKNGIEYYELGGGKFLMEVPLVPYHAYARFANEGTALEADAEEWRKESFTVDKIGRGRYFSFVVKGDSMDDDSKRSFSDGDIILARELDRIHWVNGIRFDRYPYWVISFDNSVLIKQIVHQDLQTGDITCHSLNPSPEYGDFKINLDDVKGLYRVIKKKPKEVDY